MACSSKPSSPEPLPAISGRELRKILLISDIMWEGASLIPELRKIAPLATLDLHPALAACHARSEWPGVVTNQLQGFRDEGPEPDVIIFYARSALLSNASFEVIRRRWSCPLVGMNLDDKIEFSDYPLCSLAPNDNYAEWVARFDINLTSSLSAMELYRERQVFAYHMPEGMAAAAFPSEERQRAFRHELSFVGSWRPEREALMGRLRRVGLPMTIFGQGWTQAEWCADPVRVFRDSQINLGIGWASPSDKLTAVKGRDFECPGAGGCYLTTYNWELPMFFELGKEILCYGSEEELIEMVCYFRKRPSECRRIGVAGYERCLRDHTWEKRFRAFFRDMGFVLNR